MFQNTDQEFHICMDLVCFKPEEVKITSNNKQICVSAKHEKKQGKHGYVSRQMTRMFSLPLDVDPKAVTSTMNNNGVMLIRAGKKAVEAPKEVPFPVEYKGC
ncbi:unnamed protein product [Candidula unifasciata]|uniref:SHSP domain-containing protein n=1 Tax=Candidula unifasciata TaxID=100452 RepID=A0A8S3ZW37_9EUPU|nr:unnamed protein product [Candidula unifasciata]